MQLANFSEFIFSAVLTCFFYLQSMWHIGSACRCVYSEDGVEYEANIISLTKDSARVKFLGYDNQENVPISQLSK